MQEERYIWLIYQQERDELTPTESEELNRWLEASPDNRELAARITAAWKKSGDYPNLSPVNLDEEFSALQQRLQRKTATARLRKLQTRRLMAIAATLLFLLTATGLWKWFGAKEVQWAEVQAENTVREIELYDGTQVYLRPGSRLSYPVSAVSGERPVRLEGEAFFDVAEDPHTPFRITTSQSRITVLGTRFNVQAPVSDPVTHVTVESGKVQLETLNGEQKLVLIAGQLGTFNATNAELIQNYSPNLNELAWMRGDLKFRNTKLIEVLADMENAFDITIQLENDRLADCPLTGLYKLENGPESLLENLRSFLQIKWEKVQANEFVIHNGACPQ